MQVLDSPETPRGDKSFASCPQCGNWGYMVSVGRDYWYLCEVHKTRWLIGSNLFSGWQAQTEEEQAELMRLVVGYRVVEPISA